MHAWDHYLNRFCRHMRVLGQTEFLEHPLFVLLVSACSFLAKRSESRQSPSVGLRHSSRCSGGWRCNRRINRPTFSGNAFTNDNVDSNCAADSTESPDKSSVFDETNTNSPNSPADDGGVLATIGDSGCAAEQTRVESARSLPRTKM